MGLGTFLSNAFNDVGHYAGDVGSFLNRDVGRPVIGGVEKVPVLGNIVHDTGRALTNLAQWDRDAYTWGVSRPLTTFALTGINANGWDVFNGSMWKKSWDESAYTSPGQAITANFEDWTQSQSDKWQSVFEDPNKVQQEFHNGSVINKILSGSTDAYIGWYSDPGVLTGKFTGGLRAAVHSTQGITTAEAAAKAVQRPGVQKMLDATDNMAAHQAKKMPWVARSANPDLLASIFNQTVDRGVRENAYRYLVSAGQDGEATKFLQQQASDLSDKMSQWGSTADQANAALEAVANAQRPFDTDVELDSLKSTSWAQRILAQVHAASGKVKPEDLMGVSSAGSNSAYEQALHAALDDATKKLNLGTRQTQLLSDITNMKGHINWQPGLYDVPLSKWKSAFTSLDKFGDSSALAGHIPGASSVPGRFVVQTIYKGLYNTPLKVLRAFGDMWPHGWIDFTSPRAGDEMEAYLQRARGLDVATRQDLLNRFYEAGSNIDDRRAVAAAAEDAAGKAILAQHGASEEEANEILDGHHAARSSLMNIVATREAKRAASQSFSGVTDPLTGKAADQINAHMMDDDGVPVYAPILNTMRLQGTPMMDLDALNKWASRNLGKFQTIRNGLGKGQNAVIASAELFNSMWKNGVLLRLGFTPRVMTDMGLRTAVTLGGARTLGVSKEAVANAFSNVKVGPRNFANRILKNRLFDPGTITQLQDDVGTSAGVRDAARADYLSLAIQQAADRELATARGLPSLGSPLIDDQVDKAYQTYQDAQAHFDDLKKSASKYQKTRIGDGALKYKGVTLTDIFGGENADWLAAQVSSHRMIGSMFQRNAGMEKNLSGSGSWATVRADSVNELEAASHPRAWAHAINNQIMNDELGAQVVRNKWSEADILKWFRTTQGRAYLNKLPDVRSANPEATAHAVATHVHGTVPSEVRDYLTKTGAKSVTAKKLDQLVPNVHDRPPVNGQLMNLNMTGQLHGVTNALQQYQHAMHKFLGTMPLDTFVYHPTAAALYRGHLRDQVDKYVSFNGLEDAKSLEIDPVLKQKFEQSAFNMAKNDLWQIMYDITTQSTAAHALRFIFPFMNAQQEILRHWFNIALDHPEILQREQQIWNSPGKAGIVYDTTTGEQADANTPIQNQAVRFQIPHWVSNIPGLGSLDDMGQMQISARSLNPILQGQHWYVPGAGPMAQVFVGELAKMNPKILDNKVLQEVLPFGADTNISSAILPTWAQRLTSGVNISDQTYASTFARVYQAETIRYNEGLRTSAPTLGEIQSRTRSLLILQAISSAVLPASAKFNAGTQRGGPQRARAGATSGLETKQAPDLTKVPIQALVDQYRKLEAADPANAATDFYNQYGQALFTVTMATTKTNANIPATAQGLADISDPEIKALIAQDPGIAYAIVGPQAYQGSFDPVAYQELLNTQVGGGHNETYKQYMDPASMVAQANAQLGWQQYDQLMSVINAKMYERGITSLNSSSALDLRTIKDQFLANMNNPNNADYNPDWYTQYTGSGVDWNQRINALENLVSDPNLVNNPGRTDLKILGMYLEGRDQLNTYLAQRPNKEGQPSAITDKTNADLAVAWDNFVSGLVMGNTNFALMYQHLLAGDPLSKGLKSNQSFQQSLSGIVGQ